MTIPPELRARPAEPQGDADTAWIHPAFCAFALPAEPGGATAWQRAQGTTSVSIEPGGERDRLPGGALLRRLLIHICDTAIATGQAQVALGDSAAALAAAMNPPVAAEMAPALEAQVMGVLGCRITVISGGGPALGVLDARGRPRAGAAEWRPVLRLSGRFVDSLVRDKVALDRGALAAMGGSTLALDIYCWLAATLPGQIDQTVLAESWPELQARFGAAGQDGEAFQAAFSAALAVLRAALPGLDADDDAIGVGFSARSAEAEPMPEPVPEPAPEPEPVPPPAPEPPPQRFEPRHEAPRLDQPRHDQPRPETQRQEIQRHEPREHGHGQPMRQTISLRSHITGLQQVVWLQRANGRDNVVIEVTPGSRYDPNLVTVLTLEPIVLQIAGGLHARDFERVSSWAAANRDLIDAFWDGEIDGFDDIISRVRKVPAQGVDRWRG